MKIFLIKICSALFFILLIVTLTNFSYANNSRHRVEASLTQSEISTEEILYAKEETSTQVRARKTFEVLVNHGYDYREVANQLTIGTFLDGQNILGIKVGQQASTEFGKRQFAMGVQLRHFIGNTFYATPEIYYLNFYDNHESQSATRSDDQLRSLGLGLRFGNQWQWNNFTIGCDWLGAGFNAINFKNQLSKSDTEKLSYTILNAYVGFSY
ncbi:MAG: hypothetical protein QE271_06355 [Bacteriovoracaceae bacterium]|nr:hypothetical protein [Bacteriovoracaceae bacterium]